MEVFDNLQNLVHPDPVMVMKTIASLPGYLSATPLPHAFAAACMLAAAGGGVAALKAREESGLLAAGYGCLSLWLTAVACFALADALSRYRECLRLVRLFRRYGFRTRLLRPLASSRCQRDAALAAAARCGVRTRTRAYFRGLGYRWYHLLPDPVMRNPFLFLHPGFLLQATLSRRLRPATRDA